MSSASFAESARGGEALLASGATIIVGLGNPILGDDGVGWHVAREVQKDGPGVEILCFALGGLSLMEQLIGFQRAIIVDAIRTEHGEVGEVSSFSIEALPDHSAGHTTAAHDTSLMTALRMGRAMGASLPEEVTVVGIEAECVVEFTEELTPAVAAAIPRAKKLVLELLQSKPVKGTGQACPMAIES